MGPTRPPELPGIVRLLIKIPGLNGVAELINTLVIHKLDTIESRLAAADGTANSLLENDTALLETSVHLLEALQKGRDTASRENQALLDALQQAQNEEKQGRQSLLAALQRTKAELDQSGRLLAEAVQQSLHHTKRANQTSADSLQELRKEAKQHSEVLLAALQRAAEEAIQPSQALRKAIQQSQEDAKQQSEVLLTALERVAEEAIQPSQALRKAVQQSQEDAKQQSEVLLTALERVAEEAIQPSQALRKAVQQSQEDAKQQSEVLLTALERVAEEAIQPSQALRKAVQQSQEDAKQQSEVLLAALQRVAGEAIQKVENEAQRSRKALEATVRQSSDEGKRERNSILAALQQADEQADRRIQLLRRSVQKAEDTRRKHRVLVDAARESRHEVQLHSRSLQEQIDLARQASDKQHVKLLQDLHARTNVVTTKYPLLNPEVGLMAHLYSFLPNRTALDIGANVGDVSECLLRAGYEVYAFEPLQPVFEKLQQRLGPDPRFHVYQMAIGGADETMELHIAVNESEGHDDPDPTLFSSLANHPLPEGMVFKETVPVTVRTLETLHASEEIPSDIGLVKIDTEGLDLEVVRRMGPQRYPVVLTEFWDTEILFSHAGATNRLEDLIEEMRTRGYSWYIVIYRIWGSHDIGFYCNYQQSVSNSWGNICFFTDYSTFSEARRWCTAVLPMTFFRP